MRVEGAEAALRRALRFGHHEAIVVTVGRAGEPHAAAMGVRLDEDDLVIRPYVNTTTYKNIQAGSAISFAFTHSALVFCDVVMRPSRLRFKRGRGERVFVLDADVDLYAEAVPKRVITGDQVALVYARVTDAYEGRREYFSYSRANSMLIEALVYFTKLRASAPGVGPLGDDARKWLNSLEYSISVVRRLGSSELIECAEDIYDELRRIGIYG